MVEYQSPWATEDLVQLEAHAWQQLIRGAHDAKHAYHWPTIATVNEHGMPEARTVVLRDVTRSSRGLCFYTDQRSAKIGELTQRPWISWHFYDRGQRTQLRVRSRVRIHHLDEVAERAWASLPAAGRYAYSHQPAPGSPVDCWHPGPPFEWLEQTPSLEETEPMFKHFALIYATVEHMEILHLARRGHYRAQVRYDERGVIERTWLVP